ncbi:MAG: ABC transporter ATP-binding protein [Candidatus Dormibacteria bacterium]
MTASPSPDIETILTAAGLLKQDTVTVPPRSIVSDCSLSVSKGEFVAIMGPSGAGKSTLLYLLAGLLEPDSGDVHIGGTSLFSLPETRRAAFRHANIGFVFQNFNLLPSLTAAENIALPLQIHTREHAKAAPSVVPPDLIHDRVNALMEQLGLHGLQGHGPQEISTGEQQRVAIARALSTAPLLLFADEPTGNLDWSTTHDVMTLLTRLQHEAGQTIVVVTHAAHVAAYANRVLVMRDGSIISELQLRDRDIPPKSPPSTDALVRHLSAHNL